LFQPRASLEIEAPALRYRLNMLRRGYWAICVFFTQTIQNTLQIRPTSRAVVYNRSKVALQSSRCA